MGSGGGGSPKSASCPGSRGALGRRAGDHAVIALERAQDLASPAHHAVRQPRELGDVDAVRAVGAARLEAMEEHDRLAGLAHGDVVVPRVLQLLGELHQLVVVRGEHRLAADPVVQVLGHRPRDRDAVVGRRAAADLVEQHQAPRPRVVEDGARLAHLHHEGRLAARQVVARAHPGEEPVHRADRCRGGRDERAHLGEHHAEADLPQDRGLARHVGPGHQRHPLGLGEAGVVGDERLARHHALDHRVAALAQHEVEAVVHLGPHVATGHGAVGEGGPDVEPREHARGALDPADRLPHRRA